MDLAEYERVKFELAAIMREAEAERDSGSPHAASPFALLFARLAEDRFNLVLVGRFSRGKSSVMNALLDTNRLPTGVVPLTSVITAVRYGSAERALIEHEGWALAREISLGELPDYITQQRNPGNQRRVAVAHVELPSEMLRRGFHLVDTPGLGSSIVANTRTTERFLPEADAFMLVTSYDSPLSEEEIHLLQDMATTQKRVFLIVNKHDTVAPEERPTVLQHIEEQIGAIPFDTAPQIFSVSAREAIEAAASGNPRLLRASGIPALKAELIRFLLEEKQNEFLLRMCDRVAEALQSVPGSDPEMNRLAALRQRIVGPETPRSQDVPASRPDSSSPAARFSSCWVCSRIEKAVFDHLCKFQYDVSVHRDAQAALAEDNGLCVIHTWQYEAIASPRGTCSGFAMLLETFADHLRAIANAPTIASYGAAIRQACLNKGHCPICRTRDMTETAAVARAARYAAAAANLPPSEARRFGVCVPHMYRVVEAIGQPDAERRLILDEAAALERLSEDMRRYALKLDGIRRHLTNTEEVDADHRALMLVAGHRNAFSQPSEIDCASSRPSALPGEAEAPARHAH